ncbi:MAG TPA: fibronectin type III domain-containing protein [Fibrobacteria bacterium]|nr:fibronectin type III domain-containing protein [Fibrobacteria bacterium]
MRHRKTAALCIGALVVGGGSLLCVAHAAAPTDAVSGASRGANMVTVTDIAATSGSAKFTFTERYARNGQLRVYYSTTAFASKSDTTRSTVLKMTVTPVPRNGTATINNLTAGTKYFYRLQGWYGSGEANYWATGSFTTSPTSAIRTDLRQIAPAPGQGSVDALGRSRSGAAGVAIDAEGAAVRAKSERR